MRLSVIASAILVSTTSFAAPSTPPQRTFTEVMAQYLEAPEFRSARSQLRAIELDFATRDLLLQPQLQVGVSRLNDRRASFQPVVKERVDLLSASLVKPFSTGTTVTVTPTYERDLLRNSDPSGRNTFDWQIGISQSLWRDAFGRATELRWSREGYQQRQQVADTLRAQAQTQIDFEGVYWDWAMALREREMRNKNVARGQEILRYIRSRLARSAAETSDVVQAEALLANRQLQLLNVEQTVIASSSKMQRYLPGADWEPDPNELARVRPFEQMVTPWRLDDLPETQRLELVSARNAAQAAEQIANETREQIRPDLSLQLRYGQNQIDPNTTGASNSMAAHDQTSIGVVLSTGLDIGMERRKVESARAAREAAKLHRQSLENEARVAWEQQKRNVEDLRNKVDAAKRLAELQMKKADTERARYRLGRSTAFQVITFEQDASEAEINYWYMLGSMRKMEAQARLFAR